MIVYRWCLVLVVLHQTLTWNELYIRKFRLVVANSVSLRFVKKESYLEKWGPDCWTLRLIALCRIHSGIWASSELCLAVDNLLPFLRSEIPSGSVNLNIKMAYEYTRSLTRVILFSRIPLGVQKTLLHGGGVASCGTYGHQSGPKAMPPTESSADPLCCGSRWVRSLFSRIQWFFLVCLFCFVFIFTATYTCIWDNRNYAIRTPPKI